MTPAHLPRPPWGFVGREAELGALGRAVGPGAGSGGLCVVVGPAGVGKTSLALHWAHRTAAGFPDGQLYADLRGFDDSPPVEPMQVLRGFLTALGTPDRAVPDDDSAAQALYRSLLAGRRLLVVLDNARDSAQVRPLLSGGDGCATVVTSRNRLDGLVARDGARIVPLGVLESEECLDLLRAALPDERVSDRPEAAHTLARLCGGLPLALRITAARLAAHPSWSLQCVADELADEQHRLARLSAEDTDFVAALTLSVRALDEDTRRLFPLLGVHPGTDFDAYTGAAASGIPVPEVRRALGRLAAAHLLQEHAPGRYRCHDLVRLYARQFAPAEVRRTQTARLLDGYVHTAYAASRLSDPAGRPCCDLPDRLVRPAELAPMADRADALRWYRTEAENLCAAIDLAERTGDTARAWRLTVLIWPLLTWQSHRDWIPTLEQGLRAAVGTGDPVAENRVRNLLGWAVIEAGRPREALAHLERCLALADAAGDACDRALNLLNLGLALAGSGDPDGAVARFTASAAAAEAIADHGTTALALHHLARLCLDVDRPEEALRHSERALELCPTSRLGLTGILLLDLRAVALHRTGRPAAGLPLLREALAGAQAEGYAAGEADCLEHLADIMTDLVLPADAEAYRARAREVRAAMARHRASLLAPAA
ncbi:tetratricopeptide repeat protein [Streptomyces sp. WAC06614]|nr:tetratricopeptide repeat protein [Streptomyces sp. WAC06614]